MKNDGYTGRNFNRPGFQAMLAEAEAGKIGTIIVKDMSRFCRNYLEVGFYTEILCPKKQIRFIAIRHASTSANFQSFFSPARYKAVTEANEAAVCPDGKE